MNGTCFYCNNKIGELHKQDCILVSKKVKIRMIAEYEIEVPASWDKEQIEVHRNESSWCFNNALDELERLAEEGCLCSQDITFQYLCDVSGSFISED